MSKTHSFLRITGMVLLVVLAAAPAFAQDGMMAAAERNVSFEGPDGTTLQGYLATPSGSGPFPGVIMVHEWWGLNRDIARLADALASEGYVVLAPDAFRGSVAQDAQGAMQQVRTTPREQIAGDMDAALDFLRSHELVDADRVASMGFCFGGTQSMYMGTRNPELAAVVTFYGSGPITDPDQLGAMDEAGPVLGIFGAEDGNIPVSEVRGFERAMNRRGIENTVTVYDGVGHAFVGSENYDQGGTPTEAWNQLLGFLEENL
ncbi:MAG: prolyl oligopeptidase family serine peptidase [Spirochaetes bacterium]|nr:prolyl oligopeptidase family serine peptidase [Spirochaetota bacterium]